MLSIILSKRALINSQRDSHRSHVVPSKRALINCQRDSHRVHVVPSKRALINCQRELKLTIIEIAAGHVWCHQREL